MAHTPYSGIRFADPVGSGASSHVDEASVQAFLDRMARALVDGDTETVVQLWQPPAFVLGDPEVHGVSANEELRRFFAGAREHYRDHGVVDTRAEIVDLRWPNARVAMVEVRWPWLDAAGREIGSETSTYLLRRDENGELKLRVAVMHGAAQPPGAH